ncbi:hypothetical protein DW175_01225 [Bacteroides sp. AM16-15]|jgi:hypothetical protein|nr:hypothetical protein DW175_01225 [Bacteroides sp. AM16-15]
MCGTVGCIEKRDAYSAFIKSPKRWEHRGYGSAGISLIDIGRRLSITQNYAFRSKTLQQQGFIFSRSPNTVFLILLFEYFRIFHYLDLFLFLIVSGQQKTFVCPKPLIKSRCTGKREKCGGQWQTMEIS